MKYTIKVNGQSFDVDVEAQSPDYSRIGRPNTAKETKFGNIPRLQPEVPHESTETTVTNPQPAEPKPAANASELLCPMPGNVLKILVQQGDSVSEGQTVIILEAMKMEIEVQANKSGTVENIAVQQGNVVDTNAVLMTIN